jgi:hypothetical protein
MGHMSRLQKRAVTTLEKTVLGTEMLERIFS